MKLWLPGQMKSPLTRKKPLRKVSAKRAKENVKYKKAVMDWIDERIEKDGYLRCEFSNYDDRINYRSCVYQAMTIPHHRRGRGKYLANKRYFQALCFEHHRYVHDHPAWARKEGYILKP